MYAFTLKRDSKGLLLFSASTTRTRPLSVLQKNKINVVGSAELFKRLEG
jgi:hypothetical protein